MQTNTTFRLFPSVVLTLLAGAAGAQAPLYQITDLGTLGGGYSQAFGLNNKGQVVGDSVTADGRVHPFLYTNGSMQDLGSLSTVPLPPSQDSYGKALGVNDNGQVVGQTNDSAGAIDGFLYTNGAMREIASGTPQAINNAGQIVGFGSHAFLYQNGQTTDLGTLGGYTSAAYAINNNGQITGYSDTASRSNGLAFIYQNGQMQALGLPQGTIGAEGHGISDNGEIVGTAIDSDGFSRACVWQNGQSMTIGSFARRTDSIAFGVNNSGVVVGEGPIDPFVYQNGQTSDVFTGTGWSSGEATAINNAGQIVGYGYHNGVERAFLATPNVSSVPAPGSLLTFGAGGGALLLAARRRKRNAAR